MGGGGGNSFPECTDGEGSLLGVGNPKCLKKNTFVSGMLVILIVVLSFFAEYVIHHLKHMARCPLMQKIVQKLIEEVMILGLISMSLFLVTQLGLIKAVSQEIGLSLIHI